MQRSILCGLILSLSLLTATAPAATDLLWEGDTSVTWAQGDNWLGDNPPANDLTTHIAYFNSAVAYAFAPNAGTTSIAGLKIGDGSTTTAAFTLTATGLAIGADGIVMNAGASSVTYAAGSTLRVAGNQTWTNNSTTGTFQGSNTTSAVTNHSNSSPVTLTFTGVGGFNVSGGANDNTVNGTMSIVVATTGTGFVSFNRFGSFSGGLTIKSGNAYSTASSGTLFSALSIGDTTVDNANDALYGIEGAFAKDIVVNAGSSGTLALAMANTAGSPASANFSGSITLNNKVTFFAKRSSNTLTISGLVTTNGNLVTAQGLSATGSTVLISGTNATSFTSDLNITTTVLAFNQDSLGNGVAGQGDGSITFTGAGTLRWNGTNTQDMSAKGIAVNAGITGTLDLLTNNVTFDTTNGLTGSGNITKAATAGILTLQKANDLSGTYTAGTSLGSTVLKHTNALGSATVTPNGTVVFDSTVGGAFTFGNLTGAGALVLTDGVNNVALTVGGNNASPATYSGTISGGGSIIKVGTGSTTFSGPNTFTGGLTIKQGTFVAAVANATTVSGAAGPSTVTVTLGDSTGSNSATILSTFSVGSFSNPISLGATSGVLAIGNSGNNASTYSGTVSLNGHALTILPGGSGSVTLSGPINGTGNIIVNNSGTTSSATISNAANTGSITTQGPGTGTINFTTIGANNQGITHGSGGGLTINGGTVASGNLLFNATGGAVSIAGAVTLSTTGTITNSGGTSGTTAISATIGSNIASVTQDSSTSTLALGSIAHAFTGGLFIRQGTVSGGNNANAFGADANVITLGTANSAVNATLASGNSPTYKQAIVTANNASGILSIAPTGGNPNYSGGITLNNANVRLIYNVSGAGTYTVSGTIGGTGDILAIANTGGSIVLTNTVNNDGKVTSQSTSTGNVNITGALGANVDELIQETSSASLLSIQNANAAFTGITRVKEGTLRTNSSSTLGSGNVFVESGGTLELLGAVAINNAAALTIDAGGTIKLNFAAASLESVGALTMDGIVYGGGSTFNLGNNWGGMGNVTGFFAGSTGGLTVVPEPGSLSLVGLAMVGLLARRRTR